MSKKVLFLSPQLPYPPISGGTIKSWKLAEYLNEHYNMYPAYFLKNEDAAHEAEFLERLGLTAHYSESIDVPRTPLNLIKSNLQGIPLNLYRNKSAAFKKHIDTISSGFDTIFIDHYEMYQYVPEGYRGSVILHQHNCEYLMWDRFAQVERNPLRKLALRNQAWRIKQYERRICNKSHAVLAAPNDIEELQKIGATGTKYYETYHLGDESLLASPDLRFDDSEEAILFVGTLTWEANVDGLLWFLEEAWNALKQRHPALKFYIVGKNPDPRIIQVVKTLASDIELTGFVEDLEPYFRKSRVFVSPLRFGSGIKVKVMNALYRGIPTSTTSVGSEGIALKHREHIMINDDMKGMIDSIDELLKDRQVWQKLAAASRQLARDKYTWDAVMQIVRQSIEENQV